MRAFDHVGIPTNQEQPGEMRVAATKVWATAVQPEAACGQIGRIEFHADNLRRAGIGWNRCGGKRTSRFLTEGAGRP